MKKFEIGYTTGVYDMFHIGHLNVLKNAKALCNYLIVGVSTDELVKNYKHKAPVVPFEERIAIVEAIKYVDKVIPQVSMDKLMAWQILKYDALFHGDDWKGSDMYISLEKQLANLGVSVVYLPHTQGISSTLLCEKLQGLNP